jgi:hypothetical protein
MANWTKEELAYLKAHTPGRVDANVPAPKMRPPSKLVCPHCQVFGHVRTERVKVKKGISGGKATGAVFTAGISLIATGLSRKETVTKATCGNCGSVWHFA